MQDVVVGRSVVLSEQKYELFFNSCQPCVRVGELGVQFVILKTCPVIATSLPRSCILWARSSRAGSGKAFAFRKVEKRLLSMHNGLMKLFFRSNL